MTRKRAFVAIGLAVASVVLSVGALVGLVYTGNELGFWLLMGSSVGMLGISFALGWHGKS